MGLKDNYYESKSLSQWANDHKCFECLHFLQAEMNEGVMVVYCDLRTDGVCCFARRPEGKVIVFGEKELSKEEVRAELEADGVDVDAFLKRIRSTIRKEEDKHLWRDAQAAIISAVEDYDSRSVKMSISDYLITRMDDCTKPEKEDAITHSKEGRG